MWVLPKNDDRTATDVNAFIRFSTFVVFGTVALGAVVCATDSSAACPNWPGCYEGQITPEIQLNPIIEFVHRVFSVSCAPVIIISGILLRKHPNVQVRWLPISPSWRPSRPCRRAIANCPPSFPGPPSRTLGLHLVCLTYEMGR